MTGCASRHLSSLPCNYLVSQFQMPISSAQACTCTCAGAWLSLQVCWDYFHFDKVNCNFILFFAKPKFFPPTFKGLHIPWLILHGVVGSISSNPKIRPLIEELYPNIFGTELVLSYQSLVDKSNFSWSSLMERCILWRSTMVLDTSYFFSKEYGAT